MGYKQVQKLQQNSKEFGGAIHSLGVRKYQEAIAKGYTIQTVDDMLYLWYPFLANDELIAGSMEKDAPVLSTTAGMYVADHGFNAWEHMINEANVAGLLPKEPYTYGGYRALTTAGSTSGEGSAENATLRNSTKPTALNVNVVIKEVHKTYDISARQEFLSTTPNDVWREPGGSGMAALREYEGREFVKNINRSLLTDNDTLAGDNLESLDRVVGSNSEIAGVGQDAGDLDIYGQDRDAGATTFDAYVNHASGVDRPLTSDIILDMIQNAAPNWDGVNFRGDMDFTGTSNKIWVTGWDTWVEISKIYENSNRYENSGIEYTHTMNGISTFPAGSKVGMLANSLYGIPLFRSDDVPQDTISRLYLLDLDHVKMHMGIPILNEEAGFTTGDSILLDRLGDRGMYYMSGELWADRFNCHAKARDLL